jgi:predicted amidohydrolase
MPRFVHTYSSTGVWGASTRFGPDILSGRIAARVGREGSYLMPETLSIALAQLNPRLRETGANLERLREIVAGNPDAGLIVFPELFLGAYTVENIDELAVDLDGPELRAIADVAKAHSTALVFGAAEHLGDGVANSAFCVDGNGGVAVYRKVQLYGSEKGAFVAGDELLVVDLCGVRMGVMICFDVEFPEVARALARAGAELLVTVSANMEPFGNDHAVFASARAIENGLPHAYVNQVGPGENLTFTGGSTVVSADGEVLARAGSVEETILRAELPLTASDSRESYLDELRFPIPEVKVVQHEARAKSG